MPKTSANNDEIEKEEPKINDLDIKKLGSIKFFSFPTSEPHDQWSGLGLNLIY